MVRATSRGRRARWAVWLSTVAIIVGAALFPSASALAGEPNDMVLRWNDNAVTILSTPTTAVPPGLGQGPPVSALHLAMVHGAMYDAVNAIDGNREAYLYDPARVPRGASKAAAAAQAAHDVLVGLTPATLPDVKTRIDDMLTASLVGITRGVAKGQKIGAVAAAAMLADRIGDGRFGTRTWVEGTDAGEWRVVPPPNASVFAWTGDVTPFVMKTTDQFRTDGPLDLSSTQYAIEFKEVKAKGAKTGSTRTPDEDLLASFVSANPMPYMNKGFREIAMARHLTTSQQARLFAMTSLSSADALIGCFNDKAVWNFWRPQTAIVNAGNDGNAATQPDAAWLSLYPTPGYPEQPSGYNCYTAGMMHSARLFFGTDHVSFSLTSPGTAPLAGSTRHYTRFTAVIDDTIYGRILTGFHFRTADVDGAWIGKKVAQWTKSHYFERIDCRHRTCN